MKEYIERDMAVSTCRTHNFADRDDRWAVSCLLKAIPAADVVERKRGEWDDNHRCTRCGKKALCEEKPDPYHPCHLLTLFYVDSNFCPNCGADMRSHHDSLCDQTEEVDND